jgi:hypothetical protein
VKTKEDAIKKAKQAQKNTPGQRPGKCDEERVEVKITEALTEDEMSKFRVFSPEIRTQVDIMAKRWGWCLQHQSDKSIGRTVFANGIFAQSKLAAHEVIGQMLLYLLVLCSGYASQYFETAIDSVMAQKPVYKGGQRQLLGSDRLGDFIFALEEELLSISLLKSPLTVEFVEKYRNYVPSSMFRIKKALNRTEGMGCNTLKFHLKVHRPDNLLEYGDLNSIDTPVGEHSHTDTVKNPCSRSSKQASTLDVQSGLRNYENLVIDRACQSEGVLAPYLIKKRKRPGETEYDDGSDASSADEIFTNASIIPPKGNPVHEGSTQYLCKEMDTMDRRAGSGPNFLFRATGRCKRRQPNEIMQWHDATLQEEVLKFFNLHIMPGLNLNEKITQINQCTVNGQLYKADPCDYRHRRMGGGRHDWALVKLQGRAFEGIEPKNAMHVIMFIRITDKDLTPIDKELVKIDKSGDYAIGHILASGVDPYKTEYKPVQPISEEDVEETFDYDLWKRAREAQLKRDNLGKNIRGNKRTKIPEIYKPEDIGDADFPRYERYCRGHAQSRLIMKGQKLCHLDAKNGIYKPKLCIIPVSFITAPTIAVPNLQHLMPPNTLKSKQSKAKLIIGEALDRSYLFIASKPSWARIMKRWVKKPT